MQVKLNAQSNVKLNQMKRKKRKRNELKGISLVRNHVQYGVGGFKDHVINIKYRD